MSDNKPDNWSKEDLVILAMANSIAQKVGIPPADSLSEVVLRISAERNKYQGKERTLARALKGVLGLLPRKQPDKITGMERKACLEVTQAHVLNLLRVKGPLAATQIIDLCGLSEFGALSETDVENALWYLHMEERIQGGRGGWAIVDDDDLGDEDEDFGFGQPARLARTIH